MIGCCWWNVCYIVNFLTREYLLYSKVSGGKVYYIANIPGEGFKGQLFIKDTYPGSLQYPLYTGYIQCRCRIQGRIQDFKLGGGAL
jgi:hypothetical protein